MNDYDISLSHVLIIYYCYCYDSYCIYVRYCDVDNYCWCCSEYLWYNGNMQFGRLFHHCIWKVLLAEIRRMLVNIYEWIIHKWTAFDHLIIPLNIHEYTLLNPEHIDWCNEDICNVDESVVFVFFYGIFKSVGYRWIIKHWKILETYHIDRSQWSILWMECLCLNLRL